MVSVVQTERALSVASALDEEFSFLWQPGLFFAPGHSPPLIIIPHWVVSIVLVYQNEGPPLFIVRPVTIEGRV